MFIIHNNTRCHQQDSPDYCGPASAQMVLNYLKAGLISQEDLYRVGSMGSIPAKWGTNWSTDPDALKHMLYSYQSQCSYEIMVENTIKATIGNILLALIDSRSPVPILVLNEQHWIVITGALTKEEPVPGGVCAFLGFYINDPDPTCPRAFDRNLPPPPPHDDKDTCGSGGVYGNACNSFITYDKMLHNTYLTGWYDPSTGTKRHIFLASTKVVNHLKLNGPLHHVYESPGDLVEIEKIKDRLVDELNIYGLTQNEKFNMSLTNASPSTPTLVQRLDQPGEYYYLVPMEKNKAITSMAIVDGMTGTLQAFSAYTDPIDYPIITREKALEKVMEEPIDMGKGIGRLMFREGTFSFHPVMVWKPCKESMSPYYPFYMFTIGDKQVYMDCRGIIYSQLHDSEKA
jgi:hypothetical protein